MVGLLPLIQKKGRVDVELNDKYTNEKLAVGGIEIPGDKVDTIWVAQGIILLIVIISPIVFLWKMLKSL